MTLLLLLASPVAAHPLDMGYLKVETGETIAVSFDLDVTVAAQLLHVDAATADAKVIAAKASELAAATYRAATPSVDGKPCTWGTPSAQLRGRNVTVDDKVTCPPGAASWELPFVKTMSSTFQVLARVRTGEQEQITTLDKTKLVLEFGSAGASAPSLGNAVWNGIVHGGVVPKGWPHGLEHVVFVLALLLAGGSLGRLAAIAGAFGVMHAVGALLAANGLAVPVTLQAAVPVLAVAIAIATVVNRPDPWRTIAAIVAGALHGMASAPSSASEAIGGSLGLGLAQLAMVLALAPVVALVPAEQMKRYMPAAAGVVAVASVVLVVRSIV